VKAMIVMKVVNDVLFVKAAGNPASAQAHRVL
jgi:hypothetical protein